MTRIFLSVLCTVILAGCTQEQEAKDQVRAALKDPESAQFREINAFAANVTCGQVNAKNSLGGYVGFRTFMIRDGRMYLAEDETESAKISSCCIVLSSHMRFRDNPDFSLSEISARCDSLMPTF